MTVEILDNAEEDLVEAYHFYEAQQKGVGDYFLSTIIDEIDSLAILAGTHKMIWGRYRKLSGKFPFGIFYTIKDDLVQVRAVLDLRRRPSWIRDRADK